jgi:predicted DNA-binding transcriptional regulator YafY
MFGRRVVEGVTRADGQIDVEIRGPLEEMVARQLAGLAGRFEVLAPDAVRRHLAAIGHALVRQHTPTARGDGGCR